MRGPNRKSANVALLIFVAVVLFSNSSIHGYTPIIVKPFGEVSPKLYIIALDGVDAHGVGNMTRMLNGALDACRVNFTTQYVPSAEPITYAKLEISTNVTIVRDWDQYKEIVESSSKAIIVNAHGETIPIPTNYSKEAWIDKIADAMANRNVTWVHTAGYPFYYYHNEGSSEAEWGEEGFRRLMSHIGKSNITCNYDPSLSGTERLMLNVYAESSGLIYGWPDILGAYRVELGEPLNDSEFKDCHVAIIWGAENDYVTGAIIRFAEASSTQSFGFYVHIGARTTFDPDGHVTDADYYRGYVGAGAGIWVCAMRLAAEDAISEAEKAIADAELEGRTKGLDNARKLLQEAKDENRPPWVTDTLQKASEATDLAKNATKPNIAEILALPLFSFSVVGIIVITELADRRKNNHTKGAHE